MSDEKYHNLSWLMPDVRIEEVLDRLGVEKQQQKGNQIFGMCPDHYLYTKRIPSHPKWAINVDNGKTICFTEGRGSNLVWTVCRVKRCSPEDAEKWILNGESINDNVRRIRNMRNILGRNESVTDKKLDLSWIKNKIRTGKIYENGIEFLKTGGKENPLKWSNITYETAKRFGVFQVKEGYFEDRLVIPYFDIDKNIVAFGAVAVYNKKKWLEKYPNTKKYNKILYPRGCHTSEILFGIDRIKSDSLVFIVEGARDAMKLFQLGFQAVATLGGYISDSQIEILSRKSPSIVISFADGDGAGKKIQLVVSDKLSNLFRVYGIVPQVGFDPKHYGRKRVLSLIENKLKIYSLEEKCFMGIGNRSDLDNIMKIIVNEKRRKLGDGEEEKGSTKKDKKNRRSN